MIDTKVMTTDEKNVQLVLQARVREVRNKLPAFVRKALNAAVKSGQLGHMKKDGIMPEVYYHPDYKYLAIEARLEHVQALKRAMEKIYSPGKMYNEEDYSE